jgi:hypothetical protein
MRHEDGTTIAEGARGGKRGRPHRAYLVRCWREDAAPGSLPVWRFTLEEVLHRGKRRGFNSLAALFAFLEAELGAEDKPDEPPL